MRSLASSTGNACEGYTPRPGGARHEGYHTCVLARWMLSEIKHSASFTSAGYIVNPIGFLP